MKKSSIIFTLMIMGGINLQAQQTKTSTKTKTKTKGTPVTISALKNSNDSFSYALGANIANNLIQQGVEVGDVNLNALQRAMSDVLKKKPALLSEEQSNVAVQKKLQEYEMKKASMEKVRSKAFLEENAKRKGVITLPSGLQYEVLKKSDSASGTPKIQDTVVAHYAGTLVDGREFDNSYKRGEPLTIPVGNVIKGWTEALQMMHIGDKWKVYIPSELGYGDRGAGEIPGGAALIFEMELLGIKPARASEGMKAPGGQIEIQK